MSDETRAVIRLQGRIHRRVRGSAHRTGVVAIECVRYGDDSSDGSRWFLATGARELPVVAALGPSMRAMSAAAGPVVPEAPQFHWELHERAHGVCGFLNVLTKRWLGQRLLGHIGVKGGGFGNWETFELLPLRAPSKGDVASGADISGETMAPLLCCSANANGGGWVHLSPSNTPKERGGGGGDCYGRHQQDCGRFEEQGLCVAAGSLADKRKAPMWRLHLLCPKDSKPPAGSPQRVADQNRAVGAGQYREADASTQQKQEMRSGHGSPMEGFICPSCLWVARDGEELTRHFESKHMGFPCAKP